MPGVIAQVQYAGLGIDINRVKLSRKSMADGPNYIFTRWLLHFQGIYNPAATAYARGPQLQIVQGFGPKAPETDVAIRHRLMQPRLPLLYTVGGTTVLQSPWIQGCTMDTNNGPIPQSCDVLEIHGLKTFIVQMVIQIDVNEKRIVIPFQPADPAAGGRVQQDAILSHCWSQQEDIDEHFFSMRTTSGKVVFATDVLEALRLGLWKEGDHTGDPDSWRPEAFSVVPVLPNFQRGNIQAFVDEQDNSLTYAFVDRERAMNLIDPNITKIEARQIYTHTNPDPAEVASRATMRLLAAGLGGVLAGAPTTAGAGAATVNVPSGWLGAAAFGAAALTIQAAPK